MRLRIKATMVSGSTNVQADATTKGITLRVNLGKTDVERAVNKVLDKLGVATAD